MDETRAGSRRALVIDDDISNHGVLSLLLGRMGYDVHVATTGREGIAESGEGCALAFVDIHLPDVFGTEVVASVRRVEPGALIIVATMDDDPLTLRAAYKAGCDVFLVKPYDLPAVMKLLASVRRGQRWLVDRFGAREYPGA